MLFHLTVEVLMFLHDEALDRVVHVRAYRRVRFGRDEQVREHLRSRPD